MDDQHDVHANVARYIYCTDFPEKGNICVTMIDNGHGMENAAALITPCMHKRKQSATSIGHFGKGGFIAILSLHPDKMTMTSRSEKRPATQYTLSPATMIKIVKAEYHVLGDQKTSDKITSTCMSSRSEDHFCDKLDWDSISCGIPSLDTHIKIIRNGRSGSIFQLIWNSVSTCPLNFDDPWKYILDSYQ
jgi:hypothetical protein